jgi:diguanylate cyclase (GGDEF)-like protein
MHTHLESHIQPGSVSIPRKSNSVFARPKLIVSVVAAATFTILALCMLTFTRGRLTSPAISIETVQKLPVGATFRAAGTVTFVDLPAHRFWIEDATGALVVPIQRSGACPRLGESVLISATKSAPYKASEGPGSFKLTGARVENSPHRTPLPEPARATLLSLPEPAKNGLPIQIDTIIRGSAFDEFGRIVMSIGDLGPESTIVFGSAPKDPHRFINAAVSLTALPEQLRNSRGSVIRQTFFVPNESLLKITAPAPNKTPLYSIRDIYLQSRPGEGHAVRIRGTVSQVTGRSFLLEDDWGAIECYLSEAPDLKVGDHVEAQGFIGRDGLRLDLFHATTTRTEEGARKPDRRPLLLERVADIRSLLPLKAAEALPVRLHGVITYNDPAWRQLFIQDRTGGIYAKYSGQYPEMSLGKYVELTGLTGTGNFAPVIVAPKLKVLGSGALPKPSEVSMEAANAGMLDAQYASLRGIVHPMHFAEEPSHPILTFQFYTALGPVYVSTSPGFPDIRGAQGLEDARVQISGVFATIFNSRRQLIGYQMAVSSPKQIHVLEPAIKDRTLIPVTRIDSLLSFAPGTRWGHRVKVRGTVTLVGKNLLYVQDSTGGLEVHADQFSAHVGETVEVIGYPILEGRYSPILNDSEVYTLGEKNTIPPQRTNAERLLRGSYDSRLVSVEARLVGFVHEPSVDSLLLQSGSHSFSARLNTTDQGMLPETIREGSVLRLTGIASAQVDSTRIYKVMNLNPVAFNILLRTPEDIVIVQHAPFWTVDKSLTVLSILALLTASVLVWAAILRHRVASQSAALQRASQTAQAISDLSAAMEKISSEETFETEVSVRGSRDIAQLVVGFNRMLLQLRQRDRAKRDAEEKLQMQALFDELTGLPNRRLLADRLSQSLAAARRGRSSIAILYLDLDGFKLVNDSFGHTAGDLVLQEVSKRLHSRIREADTLARLGGDEFTIIANHIGTRENATRLAETLHQSLRLPFSIHGHDVTIGASIGIAMYPDEETDSEALLEQADCAMYTAKRDGKNRTVFFSMEVGAGVKNRFTLENELRNALNRQEILVHYQPEFDLESNAIVCFEALARWSHPEIGFVSPAEFIPVAEECGLIVPLGELVMEKACREALAWQTHSDQPIQVAVNVSTQQFTRSSFVHDVKEILNRTGLPPKLLQIELTESAMLHGMQHASETLRQLRALGISVAIDDFGTGYSCLSYLPKLAFDALKIDRSFVQELGDDPNASALVHSILGLARNLRMRVIVEGIENDTQLAIVKRLGGQEGQGFLLGRPTADPKALLQVQSVAVG